MIPSGANRIWLMQREAPGTAVAQAAASCGKQLQPAVTTTGDTKAANVTSATGQDQQMQRGAQDKKSAGLKRLGRGDDDGKDVAGGSGARGKEQQSGHSGEALKAPKLSGTVAERGSVGESDASSLQARRCLSCSCTCLHSVATFGLDHIDGVVDSVFSDVTPSAGCSRTSRPC